MKKSVSQTHRAAAISAEATAGSRGLALSPGWGGGGGGGLPQEIVKLGEFLSHSGEAAAEARVGWA